MEHIVTLADAVTAFEPWMEPTVAELAMIEAEAPLIAAEVVELDTVIALMDRPANELDTRRVRRAHARVLAARAALANTAGTGEAA
ncbi:MULTISPECIES: DUF6284 family protein [Streptomyces albidoflavus group]|uniref:HNH endonuclease n=1 Tax=Streptomyces albidoflavus TaxID=1886 RepID=A0ABY3GRL3_9ACTN|nr:MULTISPECIES: DUF6284 family protein [Streptomyces albidoflavus group]TWV18745.1 hypothetical protein FRZ02_29250 [Streptomyces albidoflavus]